MQEIWKGRKCFLSIDIAQVGAVQNAVKIDTHIISPSGVVSCVANGYDELEKVVGLIIPGDLINELGAYSIDLRLVFADSVIIVPTFAFAEAVEGEAPCYGISEVYVKIEGGEVVPSGSTIVEFVNREEFNQLSNKVDDLEEQIGSGGGGSASDNNYTDADKELVQSIPTLNKNVAKNTADIKTKQDTLTLTTKPNGNIVIDNLAGQSKEFMPATPSGDPMHYVYLSYYGVSYDDVTGLYSVGYLKDLTADDMRKAFAMYGGGMMSAAYHSWIGSWGDLQPIKNQLPRTTLPVFASGTRVFYDKLHFSFCWNELEQVILCYVPPTPTFDNCHKIWQYNTTETIFRFSGMQKLRFIVDPLWCNEAYSLNIFNTLPVLEEVRIVNLQGDINFQSTPRLSKESLLYMINNCALDVSFTITLHPDVDDKCQTEWLEDIDKALGRAESTKNTNITLARA